MVIPVVGVWVTFLFTSAFYATGDLFDYMSQFGSVCNISVGHKRPADGRILQAIVEFEKVCWVSLGFFFQSFFLKVNCSLSALNLLNH